MSIEAADEEEAGPVLIGEVLANRYEIEERIGEGAMGTVYKAKHVKVGRPFAVKVLHKSRSRIRNRIRSRIRSRIRNRDRNRIPSRNRIRRKAIRSRSTRSRTVRRIRRRRPASRGCTTVK